MSLQPVRPNRLKTWLLNGLLIVVALAATLLFAEGVVRLVAPQQTSIAHQDRYGLALHWPGLVRRMPKFGTTVSMNSAGMRDLEHAFEKPEGVFRILVLGDSFMEAMQVEFEASLPSLIEQALAESTGKRIEVVNAAVSGWGTDDELRYLTKYGVKWKPDLVLVAMTLHNDISDNLREAWHTLEGGSLVAKRPEPMSQLRFGILRFKAYIATRFQVYQLWRRVRHGSEMHQVGQELNQHIVELFREPIPDRIERGFALTELELAGIDLVARANGGRTALVLLPLLVQISDSSFAEFVRSAGATPDEMPAEKPQFRMQAAAHRMGIPVIDLLPAFRRWTAEGRAPLYLQGDGHWNEIGHKLAAEVVTEGLLASGVLR